MTASSYVTIWCDCEGCPVHEDRSPHASCFAFIEPGERTAARARDAARSAGWRVSLPKGRDLCPECSASPQRHAQDAP